MQDSPASVLFYHAAAHHFDGRLVRDDVGPVPHESRCPQVFARRHALQGTQHPQMLGIAHIDHVQVATLDAAREGHDPKGRALEVHMEAPLRLSKQLDLASFDHRACRVGNDNCIGGYGGVIGISQSQQYLSNCLFKGNRAKYGGAIYADATSRSDISYSVLVDNIGDSFAGALFFITPSNADVRNCIFRGNQPDQINAIGGEMTVAYCNIQGGWSGAGSNIIDVDPCFNVPCAGDRPRRQLLCSAQSHVRPATALLRDVPHY